MRSETTVGAVLSAAHRDAQGRIHGHTWQVWASAPRTEATALQRALQAVVGALDHTILPDNLSEGEDLARHVGEGLEGCFRVRVCRPLEMIEAIWER